MCKDRNIMDRKYDVGGNRIVIESWQQLNWQHIANSLIERQDWVVKKCCHGGNQMDD